MSLADACQGLADVVATTGLRTYSEWPDKPVPPCAIVLVDNGDYGEVFQGGMSTWHLLVVLVMQISNFPAAQRMAIQYLEPKGQGFKSIDGLIFADSTLGGRVSSARTISVSRYDPQGVNDIQYLVPALDVEVIL